MITHTTCTPRAARSRLLGVSLAALLAVPVMAIAQGTNTASGTDAKDETFKLEKFVVTGSLIPIAADTPAVPITVMTSAQIENTGEIRDLTDVLKKANPFFFGRNNLGAENANTRANATNGASTVALRNRPTLVLVNGRRAALAPVAATGGATFIDVSLIPVTAVERIEVLADGASATYGTDAVSGVVNIILKTNYRGAEVGGSYGWAPDAGGYSTRRVYATMGAGNDKTQLTVTAEWRKSDPLFQYERPWGVGRFVTPSYAGVITTDGGATFYHLNPNLNAPPQNTDMTVAQLVAAGIYSGPYNGATITQFFDASERATMFQKTARRSVAIAGEHRWSENITAFLDVVLTASDTESVLNAQPVSGNVAGNNPNNPFDVQVQARNRFRAFPRFRLSEAMGGRVIAGLRGSLAGSWNYEVAAGLNRTTQNVRQVNLIDATAYNAAVLANTYNPFARTQASGVIEGLVGTGYQDYVSRLVSFDARFTGDLMNLPAGAAQLGISLDTRKETVSMVNDRNDRQALWLGGTPTNPFAADQSVDGFGAELRLPIFSATQSMPLLNSLEVTLAARKELYNSTTDPLVPKVSLRWMPFNDEFVVRATYGESFNAPALFSLYGPSNSGFSNNYNILRYDASGNPILLPSGAQATTGTRQSRARGGSNPDLVPSEARNWTAGFVWSPRRFKGLTVALDWFNLDERDVVAAIPQATIFQNVEQFGPASPYARQIRLAPSVAGETHFTDGAPITAPGQISGIAADSVWLTNPVLNISGLWQAGADLRLDYQHDTAGWGKFSFTGVATYIHEYWVHTVPTLNPNNFVDGFVGGGGSSTFPRYRTFSTVDWTYKNLTLGLSHTFIPPVDDLAAVTEVQIDSYQTFDLRASYSFAGSSIAMLRGLRVSAGVNNVLGEDPPYAVGETDQNRDINTYDALGRFIYVSASYKF